MTTNVCYTTGAYWKLGLFFMPKMMRIRPCDFRKNEIETRELSIKLKRGGSCAHKNHIRMYRL